MIISLPGYPFPEELVNGKTSGDQREFQSKMKKSLGFLELHQT